MIEYPINGRFLKLELFPGVFQPTTCTQLLAEQMVNIKEKTVLDLGCGAGPIAITATLNGAKKVYAVDVMEEACKATSRNSELNGIAQQIDVRQGNLFEPLKGLKFDVIVDDVSGMADEVSRISPWYPEPIPTGGYDGSDITVRMLRESPAYLNDGGYLLFPLISLAYSEKILTVAHEIYGNKVKKIVSKMIPFCDELYKNMELLVRLKDAGIIHFIQKRSRYMWNLTIYRINI